jgi:hypothetical protein
MSAPFAQSMTFVFVLSDRKERKDFRRLREDKLVVEVISDKICVIMRGGSAVDTSYDTEIGEGKLLPEVRWY